MKHDARILLSKNYCIDIKLCIELICDCFEPTKKAELCDEYQILIIGGHSSYISTQFIWFMWENKIVCLCLQVYFTLLLQSLFVVLFGPLKQDYKTLLAKKTTCNIDKADLVNLIQNFRQQGITVWNIQSE